MALFKTVSKASKGALAPLLRGTRAKSIGEPRAARGVRLLLPIIKSIGVVLLMVWAIITLSKWAGDEAEIDTAPRIAMDDFAVAYRQLYLSRAGIEKGDSRIHRFYIVDVRMESAFSDGHIPGALSVPEGALIEEAGERRIGSLLPDTASKIILYCG